MKVKRTRLLTLALLLAANSVSAESMNADQIRAIRQFVESQKEAESQAALSPEERAARQGMIDAEVTANFKKRIQMRPSDVASIDPACDEWLLLYKESGWGSAKRGIEETCP